MRLVAVDLAAKYSAAIEMDSDGKVLNQVDSWGLTESEFLYEVTKPWYYGNRPDLLVVEDLPHGVPFMINTKTVCRMQGRIFDRLWGLDAWRSLVFVAPAAWRKHWELKNGTGPDAVVRVAGLNGYTAPDLSHRVIGKGDKAIARKVATDYCAAYLIAGWFQDMVEITGSTTFPGTSLYGDTTFPRLPRKTAKEKASAAEG